MPFHLTRDGVIAEIPADSLERANAIASRDEWETIAGVWPLKRLVAIWNALPGVTPVEKFTNRQIALERIWRAIESPERAQAKAQGKREQTKARFREGSKASPSVCPALPAGRCNGARDPGPHRVAAAQCAGFPFGQPSQTGPEPALVRTSGRARLPGQGLKLSQ